MRRNKMAALAIISLIGVSALTFGILFDRRSNLRVALEDERGVDIADLQRTCGVCHLPPGPEVLPKSGWESFMSRKALVLTRHADSHASTRSVVELLLAEDNLQRISNYIVARAQTQEELLTQSSPPSAETDLFRELSYVEIQPPAAYTAIEFDSHSGMFAVANNYGRSLDFFDLTGRITDSAPLPAFPVVPFRLNDRWLIPVMSMRPAPGELAQGKLVSSSKHSDAGWEYQVLLDHLRRPIRISPISVPEKRDFFLIFEFGWFTGELGLYKFDENNTYAELSKVGVLDERWGAIDAKLLNVSDTRIELAFLTSQENEELWLIGLDRHSLKVIDKKLLYKQHPAFGFNSLNIADVDGDGKLDIVVTNGDNMDIPTGPLKPYHGIRIFVAKTDDGTFHDPHFLPFHGAIQTVIEDFTGDGILDIFAISAFPDYTQLPFVSAILYVNGGNMRFSPQVVPAASGGRWSAATAADWDGDGDFDIALAGVYTTMNAADQRWTELSTVPRRSVLFLENQFVK